MRLNHVEMSCNHPTHRGEHLRADVWGTDLSIHPMAKANPSGNILHVQNLVFWKEKKKISCWAVSSASVFSDSKPNWQIAFGFFCCILRKWEQKYAHCTRKWVPMRGIFFSIFQVNVFLMVKWHFTKNLNSWLASVWNKTANPNITDMNPDAGFYSIQNTWVWHHQIFKRPYIITKLDSTFYCKKIVSVFSKEKLILFMPTLDAAMLLCL